MNTESRSWPAARFAIPLSILCLIVYWHAFKTWFTMDDFAWLGLPLDLQSNSLASVLFQPEAQGTVRVLSERVFFLVFTMWFGMNPLPFKICVYLTQFGSLTLLAVIAKRLTKSTLAGYIAAIAFLFNSTLGTPLAWLAAYNEVLWVFTVLLAFYFLLRYIETGAIRYNVYQWIVFLLGFGVLEMNVVYPAIAALYTLCCARRYLCKTLPLFVPAILFAIGHFMLVPKNDIPLYKMYFDANMLVTLAQYARWVLGPSRFGELIDPAWRIPGFAVTILVAIVLAVFALSKQSPLVIFLIAWFVVALAPVLPLREHITDYYPMCAIAGPCILAGWAFVEAWRKSTAIKAVAAITLALYCAGHYAESSNMIEYRYVHSRDLREVMLGVNQIHQANPGKTILLGGVDWDLFAMGFNDNPFRLYGIDHVYLVPGSETQLAQPDLPRGVEQYKISLEKAVEALDTDRAVVLSILGGHVNDVTSGYRLIAHSQFASTDHSTLDVGLPASASKLGDGWFEIENGFRWMGPSASVSLAAPGSAATMLAVSGYCPLALIAKGPLHLTLTANGQRLGTIAISKGDEPFTASLSLPASLHSGAPLTVVATVDRVTTLPGEPRKLGVIFGKFSIQ